MPVFNNYKYPNKLTKLDNNYLLDLAQIVTRLINGKTNNCGELTLTPSATSTTVKNILCNENSVILLTPTTANAAADVGAAGSVWVVAGDKEFVVNHPSDADTNKIFRYIIVG